MSAVSPDPTASAPAAERPLRRDAERNRQRILAAAGELFAERGIAVTLDDIAAHAGVGVGTVYRRFADRNALVDALFHDQIDALTSAAGAALEMDDPWDGLVAFLTSHLLMQQSNRGFATVVLSDEHGEEAVEHAKSRIKPLVGQLVARAHAAGVIRPDFAVTDVPVIAMMLSSVLNASRDAAPELWRRYLAIVLDGIRPGANSPLPAPAVTDDQLPTVMRCGFGRQ